MAWTPILIFDSLGHSPLALRSVCPFPYPPAATMSRINIPSVDQSPAASKPLLDAVNLKVLTNYVNNVARTDVDFPVVQARAVEHRAA